MYSEFSCKQKKLQWVQLQKYLLKIQYMPNLVCFYSKLLLIIYWVQCGGYWCRLAAYCITRQYAFCVKFACLISLPYRHPFIYFTFHQNYICKYDCHPTSWQSPSSLYLKYCKNDNASSDMININCMSVNQYKPPIKCFE